MSYSKPKVIEAAIAWGRADQEELDKFDPSSKICTMNCGPHRDDPRSHEERKFLCQDCINA